MKETIDQLMAFIKDKSYGMSPGIEQGLTKLVKQLDNETDDLAALLQQVHLDYEHVADVKVAEYVSYLTKKPIALTYQDYGAFKLALAIENQVQNELN